MLVGICLGTAFYAPHVAGGLSLRPLAFEPTASVNLNFEVYHVAAEVARDGGNFYDAPPEGRTDDYVYLYPPVTVLAFYPFTLVGPWTGYLLATALTVLASAASTWAVVAYVEDHGRRLGWLDAALIFAFFLGSIYAAGTVIFGNVNLWLAGLTSVALFALLRGREAAAGALFALAALFKLFPALVGLWLLRVRAWRATAAAIATGVAGILFGVVVFGLERTEYYALEVVARRSETGAFVGGYPVGSLNYVTVQRPVSWLVWTVHPGASTAWLYAASAFVLAFVLAFFYADLSRPMDRHAAVFATVTVAVVAFPALRWYLVLVYLPLLVLAYDWAGPGYPLFLAGGALFSLSFHPRDVHASLTSPADARWIEGANGIVPSVDLPAVVATLSPALGAFAPLAVLGTPQLWGLFLVSLACAISKVAAETDPVSAIRRWHGGERPAPWIGDDTTPPYGPDRSDSRSERAAATAPGGTLDAAGEGSE